MHPMGHAAAQAAARERGRGAAAHLKCGTRRTRFRDERRRPPQTCSQKKPVRRLLCMAAEPWCGLAATAVAAGCAGRASRVCAVPPNAVAHAAARQLRCRLVPPGRERGATTVCVRHTAWRTLRGVQLVGQRLGVGRGREGSPHATRRGRRWATACAAPCACVRRAGRGRALEPKRCASKRNRKFADGGLPADKKIEQLVFQSQARRKAGRGAGGRASRLGTPGPSRSASAARLARLVKKRKRRPPEGAPTAGEAHRSVGGVEGGPSFSTSPGALRVRGGGAGGSVVLLARALR